jgi:hypothetical protein
VPLPSWALEHSRAVDPRDQKVAERSREWESENQVLGRNNKSSLYRPRELVSLKKDTMEEEAVFSNPSWDMRIQIEKALQCLLALQDARQILDARGINPQKFHQFVPSSVDAEPPALSNLRRKTATLLLKLSEILGVERSEQNDCFECNQSTLLHIISTEKGKKLVCRALPLLHPSARCLILPPLLEYLVGKDSQRGKISPLLEGRLSQTLVLLLMYHPPLPPSHVYAECIEKALSGHTTDTMSLILQNRVSSTNLRLDGRTGPVTLLFVAAS